jgi:hypothetical protein
MSSSQLTLTPSFFQRGGEKATNQKHNWDETGGKCWKLALKMAMAQHWQMQTVKYSAHHGPMVWKWVDEYSTPPFCPM